MTRISRRVGRSPRLIGIGRRLAAATLLLASAGIIHGSPARQGTEAAGEYILESANDQGLPAVVSESGDSRQEVTGGSVVLAADGTFAWRRSIAIPTVVSSTILRVLAAASIRNRAQISASRSMRATTVSKAL